MLKLLKRYKFVLAVFLVCLIGIGSCVYEQGKSQEFLLETNEVPQQNITEDIKNISVKEESVQAVESMTSAAAMEGPQIVPVYICGEVKRPGVYYMDKDALINEAINISGGFTEEANTEYLNLASPIQANGKIVVPKQGEEIDKNLDSYDNKESIISHDASNDTIILDGDTKCIDINAAPLEELMSLPGIGEAKAKAIKAYREENGGFKSTSELTEVDGIGDKTFDKIKELITVQ